MWTYLDHLSTLVESFNQVLTAMPDSEEELVREGLLPRTRTMSVSAAKRPKQTARGHVAVPFITEDGGQLIPGEK